MQRLRTGSAPRGVYQAARREAAGGAEERAFPAAASLHALHVAIHLVDDIIDGEERPTIDLPPGLRANLALALQSIAVEVLEAPEAAP